MEGRRPLVLSAAALAALVLVTGPPAAPAAERPGPAPDVTSFANCGLVVEQGGSDDSVTLARGGGLTQPIATGINVLSSALGASTTLSRAWAELLEWDPVARIPDPTKIALRARGLETWDFLHPPVLIGWSPPLVTRCGAHLAEAPRTTVALDYVNSVAGYAANFHYQADGPAEVPEAYAYSTWPTTARVPLAGAHPVLDHVLCGGDSALQALSVCQSVVTPNYTLDSTWAELIQRFRVPVETRLHWIELGYTSIFVRDPFVQGAIAIVDAEWWSDPPVALPAVLVEAPLQVARWWSPVWDSHLPFDRVVTLEPGHDYWLWVAVRHCYGFYSRRKTGREGPDFLADIGSFQVRTSPTGPWVEKPDQTLCFKLIGEPSGATRAPAPSGVRLRVSPNPVRGGVAIGWAVATGGVRFEVLDAHGRRVGESRGFPGATGDWPWDGTGGDGRALPAGVYFVRATDGAGRHAVARVVLVR